MNTAFIDGQNLYLGISGDGDYKKVVEYLISKNRFLKILFPNKKFSSLYKTLGNENWMILSSPDMKELLRKRK